MTDLPPPPPSPVAASDPDAPGAAPASRPGPTRLQRTTALVATVGVVVVLIGLLVLLRPVSTPTQSCGTSLGVLLDGRANEYVYDVQNPPAGITRAEAEANNARPCRERVADIARPAAVAMAVGLVAAVGALIVEVVDRSFAWRRRARGRHEAVAATGSPGA
ncbi:MAG: hypothetical protein KDB04_02310 [Acidimicrobiales bacterium]|nr:hypothetical protein [Acidimicrobiales bacterium]HRW36978.1 hypothetical protein [Aquihabitans sp.]